MSKRFIVWGTVVCMWLAYANYTGWSLFSEAGSAHKGSQGTGRMYHK